MKDAELFKERLLKLCDRERSIGASIGRGEELGSGSPFEACDEMFDELLHMYREDTKENS